MLKRFSVSMEAELIDQFDAFIRARGYENRSEAIRDLFRKEFVQETWDLDGEVAGVITLAYDHHQPQLQQKITEIQHESHELITAVTHVHMDHDNCLEAVIVKGRASAIRELAERMIALRGVKNGHLTMSCTGRNLR